MSHKTVPIITCFKKLKERSLRLYRNAIKAIYGEGLYFLSPAYEHLKCTYDQFKDLTRPENKKFTEANVHLHTKSKGFLKQWLVVRR